jgi:signal transduction histidine kinase
MKIFASLRNRIFLTSALLAVLAISVAIYRVNIRVTAELELQLQREMVATRGLVDKLRDTRAQTFTLMARLIADAPKLKAAVDTGDPPTVQETLNGYQTEVSSTLLLVTNNVGGVLAIAGASPEAADVVSTFPSIRQAVEGRESSALLPQSDGVLQLVTVPIAVGLTHPDILGTLSVGFLFDDRLAAQLKEITGSDVAFGMDGNILATTLPAADRPALARLAQSAGRVGNVTLTAGEFVALPLPLASDQAAGQGAGGAIALILRSRNDQLRVLGAIRNELAITAVVAVLLATLLSFAVAGTITRPLGAITGKMREVAATGDLTRKIVLRSGQRWDDADARLLATTFNMLTDSIARFQREMSQKERLSSLGRLSTVIAHEVRNPLMIIKAALHSLRQPDLSAAGLREAVADIDEEIVRLNRIVNEVLDFARPIQFDLAPADLNVVCRDSAAAASAGAGAPVRVELDPSVGMISTDAERLRLALVNLVMNARQAFEPQLATSAARAAAPTAAREPRSASGDPQVVLSTRAMPGQVVVTITDNGAGIGADDLPRAFDPYFTTKRGGTGLGLPIAKHVVEGLGGTITVATVPGRGTEVRIVFDSAPSFATIQSIARR